MTAQEQDLQRLQAWDSYQANKTAFLARRKRLQDWANPLGQLANKLMHETHEVNNSDAQLIPNQQIFQTAAREFQEARVKFERSRAEAVRFNWPVAEEDVELLNGDQKQRW